MELGGLLWTSVLKLALPPQRHGPDAWLEHQEPFVHTAVSYPRVDTGSHTPSCPRSSFRTWLVMDAQSHALEEQGLGYTMEYYSAKKETKLSYL